MPLQIEICLGVMNSHLLYCAVSCFMSVGVMFFFCFSFLITAIFFFSVAVLRDPVILGSTLITYSVVVGEQRLLMQQVREGESCSSEV